MKLDSKTIEITLNYLRHQPIAGSHEFIKWHEKQLETPSIEDAFRAGANSQRILTLNTYRTTLLLEGHEL